MIGKVLSLKIKKKENILLISFVNFLKMIKVRSSLLLKESLSFLSTRNFSYTSVLNMRRPPKEEFENSGNRTRKRTADPFDRRWSWTAKRAEPYNIRGGHMDWTKMPITR